MSETLEPPQKIEVRCQTCNTPGRLTPQRWVHTREQEDGHAFVPKTDQPHLP